MTERLYGTTSHISREDAERAFRTGDPLIVSDALVKIALGDRDALWVEDVCRQFTLAPKPYAIRAVAFTCLGHIVRLHGRLTTPSIEVLMGAVGDPDVGGRAEDALRDMAMFARGDERWAKLVLDLVEARTIGGRLATEPAIVLSRSPRVGAIHWYHCADVNALELLRGRLLPSSVVSFYFGGRIRSVMKSGALPAWLQATIQGGSPFLIGNLADDGIEIDGEVLTDYVEAAEALREIPDDVLVFCGSVWKDDEAITFRLPDVDGVTRPHPIRELYSS